MCVVVSNPRSAQKPSSLISTTRFSRALISAAVPMATAISPSFARHLDRPGAAHARR